jgi:hypothetical protein
VGRIEADQIAEQSQAAEVKDMSILVAKSKIEVKPEGFIPHIQRVAVVVTLFSYCADTDGV